MPPIPSNSTTAPTLYHHQSQTTQGQGQGSRSVAPSRYSRHMGIPFFIRPVPLDQYPPLPEQQQFPQTILSARVPYSVQYALSTWLEEANNLEQDDPWEQISPSHQVLPANKNPLSQQQQQGPASVTPATKMSTIFAIRTRDPKLSRTPARTINLTSVNWGLVSYHCPYIHPVTGVRCLVASTRPVQWRLTKHAATHVFSEIREMCEGNLGFCQGTIVSSLPLYERFRDCWFFCEKCMLVKSQPARTAGIKFSMAPGTFMCETCEEQYFVALNHYCRPR